MLGDITFQHYSERLILNRPEPLISKDYQDLKDLLVGSNQILSNQGSDSGFTDEMNFESLHLQLK